MTAEPNEPIGSENKTCAERGRGDDASHSARLDRMYGRLIGAMASSSDPRRVRCLAGRYALLRIMERDSEWLGPLWCRTQYFEYFEDEMKAAEGDLARE